MPALFDVPGWSVGPSAPLPVQSKKRKRNTVNSEEQELLHNAQVNLDKLIGSLGGSADDASKKQKKKKTKHNKSASQPSQRDQHADRGPRSSGKARSQTKPSPNPPTTSDKKTTPPKKKAKKKDAKQPTASVPEHSQAAVQDTDNLTPLQQTFKKSLDGARFRFVQTFVETRCVNSSITDY